MVYTTVGKERAAIRLGSNINTPDYVAVGDGSGSKDASTVALVNETKRTSYNGVDFSTSKKAAYTFDFNSVEMSGTTLTEIGQFSSGAANTGSAWLIEGFGGVNFDGSNELQVETKIEVT